MWSVVAFVKDTDHPLFNQFHLDISSLVFLHASSEEAEKLTEKPYGDNSRFRLDDSFMHYRLFFQLDDDTCCLLIECHNCIRLHRLQVLKYRALRYQKKKICLQLPELFGRAI